ncbi:unnamed protein product [Calicophoron daubneyi]|uniref:Uncharacterized protein n=1 Tax=Calicophoron daubneyi TaxID=300641 RepID=A0AAV2TAL1_CALDB
MTFQTGDGFSSLSYLLLGKVVAVKMLVFTTLLCFICDVRCDTATFSPILSDDRITPFAFTHPVYDAILLENGTPQQYVLPLSPHMGVPEPFGGNPSGTVSFRIQEDARELSTFIPKTFKLGKFFFLRLFTSLDPDITRRRTSYRLTVEAVFSSNVVLGAKSIQLRNRTEVRIKLLERNENCPFFSSHTYSFAVREDTPVYRSVGKVVAVDADVGFSALIYFYLDPAEEAVPFIVDPYSGGIYPTCSLARHISPSLGQRERYMVPLISQNEYRFKVYAAHRGDKSLAHCNIVSMATVHVKIVPVNIHTPNIIVDAFADVKVPGVIGVPYARISVNDPGSSPESVYKLRIVEPDMREKLELVSTSKPSEWLLQIRSNLSSVSLAARLTLTLEASNEQALIPGSGELVSSLARKSWRRVDIPLVSKSTYRLSFPDEIKVALSESALVNCTIAILQPRLPYRMTNSSFLFTDLRTTNNESENSGIVLTSSGSVLLTRELDIDLPYTGNHRHRGHNSSSVSIPFTVVDRNNLLLSSAPESRVIIEIMDVNDNDPVVRNNGSVHEVREDISIGTVVFQVDAYDPDLSNTPISYALYNAHNLPFFLSEQGGLFIRQELDAETMPEEFTLYVRVSDSGLPMPRSVLAIFTIRILDVNEYAPEFVELSCEAWLTVSIDGTLAASLNDVDRGFILGRYSAEDPDRDGQNSVRIHLGSSSFSRQCFKVDGSTGELTVTCPHLEPPDSEIILTLLAMDGTRTSDIPFKITINLVRTQNNMENFSQRCKPSGIYKKLQGLTSKRIAYAALLDSHPVRDEANENMHHPKFPLDLPTELYIPENLPLGTKILQFSASDEDGSEFSLAGQVVYGIEAVRTVSAEAFGKVPNTGADIQQSFLLRPTYLGDDMPMGSQPSRGASLIVAAPLDREVISSYSLILHACDLGSPTQCASSPLHIILEDLDDHPPEFQFSALEGQSEDQAGTDSLSFMDPRAPVPGIILVPEDLSIGSRIAQVVAVDRDVNDEIRYRLRTHTDVFKIHHRTGRIRLLRRLDRELQSSYELIIEATGHSLRSQNRHLPSPRYIRLLKLAEANTPAIYHRLATTRIVVTVTDVNDNAPVFVSPSLINASLSTTVAYRAPADGLNAWFGTNGYTLVLPEDVPEGAYLTTLTAHDADEGANGLIGFSLFGNPRLIECFNVEQLTGVVRLAAGCDLSRITANPIRLTAWAVDHGTPQLSTNTSFVVHVIPVRVNVFPPRFHKQPALYQGWIRENTPVGSEVSSQKSDELPLRLEATDPEGANVAFFITGGSGIGYFYVDDNGIVRNMRVLNAESLPEDGGYWLTIYAVEHSLDALGSSAKFISTESQGPMRAIAEVFIEVLDENDNLPVPLAPQYSCRIVENSPSNVIIAEVTATDPDQNEVLRYRIASGDPQGHFSINPTSGTIVTTARPLDREAMLREIGAPELTLTVSISDQGTPPKICEVAVRITVLDENDQSPRFVPTGPIDKDLQSGPDPPLYHFRAYERELSNYSGCVGRVFAVDLDEEQNGSVFYWRDTVHETGRTDYSDGGFDVRAESGFICTNGSFVKAGEYRIRVYAKDRGKPAWIANNNIPISVHISILPSPHGRIESVHNVQSKSSLRFTYNPLASYSVPENQLPNHRLFNFAVSDALDPTGSSLTYILMDEDRVDLFPFGLGQTSLTESFVYLAARLNHSIISQYHLVLVVSNGFDQLTAKVVINIEPVPICQIEFSPEHFARDSVASIKVTDLSSDSPSLGAEGYRVQANLSESVLVGSLVVRLYARISCVYHDSNITLRYSISTVGQAETFRYFTLDEGTGDLRVARPLDCESFSEYYLVVMVSDSGMQPRFGFISVWIHVTDANEYAPQFLGLSAPQLALDHSLSARDSFELAQRGAFVFFADGTSPVGTIVGRVTAFDPDLGENGCITYNIVGGDTAEFFDIDPVSGDITLAKSLLTEYLDSESHKSYDMLTIQPPVSFVRTHRIIVSARDGGRPVARSNYTEVVIRIIPGPGGIDAPAPQFRTPRVVHFSVMENSKPGYVIAPLQQLMVPDTAVHGLLTFRIVRSYSVYLNTSQIDKPMIGTDSPSRSELFYVTPSTGLLVTLVQLDREHHGDFHRLLVEVRGSHGIRAHTSDNLLVEVQIMDQNDNAPSIISPISFHGKIAEDAVPGTPVMLDCNFSPTLCDEIHQSPVKLQAFDPDLGSDGQIQYQLVSFHSNEQADLFSVEPSTGLVRLAKGATLDRETMPVHSLIVQVSDCGSPSLSADTLIRIEVQVTDVNDSPPVFGEPFYTGNLLLPTYPFELILRLDAVDPDLNDSVTYRFFGGVGVEHFVLHPKTGELRVAPNSTLLNTASLLEHNFLIEVEAIDSHHPLPHQAFINVTIFARLAHPASSDHTTLVIEPEGGLDVKLVEHFHSPEPFRLGQLAVRDALVGAVHRFVVLTPVPGLDVNRLTGTVTATGNQDPNELDRELNENLVLHVLVRDMHNRLGRTVVRVHLLDINDNQPCFIGLPYHAVFCLSSTLPTDAPGGRESELCNQNHFKVTAVDKDKGVNGTVSYSLATIRPRAEPPLLSINNITGQLSLLRLIPPDWTGRQLEAVVVAVDGGGLSSSATVTIHLVSTEGPHFTAAHYTASVRESAPIGEAVTSVEANSPHPSASLIYRIVSVQATNSTVCEMPAECIFHELKPEESPFLLEFNTGIIRVAAPLDFETTTRFNLLLEVLDTATSLSARVHLSINVTDVNDVAPRFSVDEYFVPVSESEQIGHVVLRLHATDPDSGFGGQVTYSLEPLHFDFANASSHDLAVELAGSAQQSLSFFACDPETGNVILTHRLDFLAMNTHRFIGVATDQGVSPLSSRVPITVTVLDYNNHAPQFDPVSTLPSSSNGCLFRAKLNELAPPGTFVMRLLARDMDVNDTLIYRLVASSNKHSGYFRLGYRDGILLWAPFRTGDGRLKLPPEPSNSSTFPPTSGTGISIVAYILRFQVEVSDGTHSATCGVHVEVEFSNWDAPKFPHPKHEQWNISEAELVGARLGRIPQAKDMDKGRFGKISYTLTGGHGREHFRLDSDIGDLYLSLPLDRETVDHYQLVITATDGGGLFDHLTLDLSVMDVNDNRPKFVQATYDVTLLPKDMNASSLNYPLHTGVYLEAIDSDEGDNARLVYRKFLPPSSSGRGEDILLGDAFGVDPNSGELLISHPMKSEILESQLFVEACDAPSSGVSTTLCSSPAKVTVHFARREPPSMPKIRCTSLPLLEDDQLVDRNVAVCRVDPTNLTGSWLITSAVLSWGLSVSAFRINSRTGQVFTAQPLDYESGRSYQLGVEFHLTDVKPVITARTKLQIDVIDVNDCTPHFDAPIYNVNLLEDTPVGTRILRTQAMDPDADHQDPITYSIWPATLMDPMYSNSAAVAQQARSGLTSMAQGNAEVGLIRKLFTVDSSGWIFLKGPLDFETQQDHTFRVVAMDSVGHWNSSIVHVAVGDVNDNAPHWGVKEDLNDSLERILSPSVLDHQILSAEIRVSENWFPDMSEVLYQLTVMDPDMQASSSPTFYLLPDDDVTCFGCVRSSALFWVSSSGSVHLRHALDREVSATHILKFRASDGVFVTRDVFSLLVHVDDVNDNAPICSQPDRHLRLPENTVQGTILTRLAAIDADAEAENSAIIYSLSSGDQSLFLVENQTGILRLRGSLDFEKARDHFIRVTASDPGGLACTFTITVDVLDVNDNAPKFDLTIINPIPEDAPVGSLIGKVTAYDLDTVDANRLLYSILSPRDSSFSIEPHTGLIKINQQLDRETQSLHVLTVLVTDGLKSTTAAPGARFTATTTLTVRLLDVNDSPPQFANASAHKLHVSEMAPPGQQLTRLKAVSLDEGPNSVVRYRLLTKQPEFKLNETTGDLTLHGQLDHERTPTYFLTVEAHDHGNPPLSTTTVVTVNVDDENDNQPRFLGRQRFSQPTNLSILETRKDLGEEFSEYFYRFSVIENSQIGTVAGKLNAVDADSGENGRLSFYFPTFESSIWPPLSALSIKKAKFLSSTEVQTHFKLDQNSGSLSLLFEPDRESLDEYWLVAAVTDHGKPTPLSTQTMVCIRVLDMNDCPPVFEKTSYEFVVEVDRAGNISNCFEKQSTESQSVRLFSESGRVLIGRLRITDADANPNAGPFTCQLTHSGSSHPGVDSSHAGSLFLVRNSSIGSSLESAYSTNITTVESENMNFSSGECLLYAVDRLPVGSQSLVVRANDNGLTALHASVTVTIRVVRQANLPPEIVRGNATLTYYRGSVGSQVEPQLNSRLEQSEMATDLVIARVTVKDRTAHDRLNFELLPDGPGMALFRLDRYDGTIRSAPTTGTSDAQSATSMQDQQQPSTVFRPTSFLPPIAKLDSGVYPLRIRVTNGSLASEEVVYIKVVAITEEMLGSSVVIRISNLLPNLLYMENYDRRLRAHLASVLLPELSNPPPSGHNPESTEEFVFILSVQEAGGSMVSTRHNRPYRSVSFKKARSLDRATDVLVSVYDPNERDFIQPVKVAQALNKITDRLSNEFGGRVEVIYDICTPQFCPRGRCRTKVLMDPHGLMNRIEVHRVSQVSPRFSLAPVCECPKHFTGPRCDIHTSGCSVVTCPSPRVCIPQGRDSHICICPPPRIGPNCESVEPVGQQDACYSERCFQDRERGSLQFTGGSFIHWEMAHSNPNHLEMRFTIRTRQITGPLLAVRWSALRAFQLRLATGGRLVVSATSLTDGLPSADWLVSAQPLSDGHWHRVRLVLTNTLADQEDKTDVLLFQSSETYESPEAHPRLLHTSRNEHWWIELTVNGINPRSASIDWSPGDPVQQSLLIGADLVHGFHPLSPPFSLKVAPVMGQNPRLIPAVLNTSDQYSTVMRSGFVGCIKDIRINQHQPPYQINLHPSLTQLHPVELPVVRSARLVLLRAHKINYGCDPSATVSGPCASGPCLYGGTCTAGAKHSLHSPYTCHCPALFHGRHCERTNDACLLMPCQNGGSCQPLFGPSMAKAPANSGLAAYRCVCPAGVSGLHCEIISHSGNGFPGDQKATVEDGGGCRSAQLALRHLEKINPRTNVPGASSSWKYSDSPSFSKPYPRDSVCLHGGVCSESPSGPYCSCPVGWQGARCEHDVDECILARSIFSNRGPLVSPFKSKSSELKWIESHGPGSGGLCSPYEVGRGVCVNTPGSYRCNCSLGFAGRHCQSKNLVPLTPDPNALGLTQLHVYIIVGLLAFLFLAALTTIILLACRARGLMGGSTAEENRTGKSPGPYWWSGTKLGSQQHKSTGNSSDTQFYRYNHSAGSSMTQIPFLAPSPAHPGHPGPTGAHSSLHGYPHFHVAHRRPSLASSTFVVPAVGDDSGAALLPGHAESVKRGSSSSAAPTITDFVERDDSSIPGNSRLVLYPTSGGDAVPVVMMMSPSLPYANPPSAITSRSNAIPRYSPASSVVFYAPSALSGSGTPTNQGSSSYIGYSIDPPGSACIPQRQMHGSSHVTFYPAGQHPAYISQPNSQQQLVQLIGMRPSSAVGSDRLSLGSGSDRFSAHSSQALAPPNAPGSAQLLHHHTGPQGHPYYQVVQQNTDPNSRTFTPQHLPASYPTSCGDTIDYLSERTPGEGTRLPRLVSADHTRPKDCENLPSSASQSKAGIQNQADCLKPRPLPANLQHFGASPGRTSEHARHFGSDLSFGVDGGSAFEPVSGEDVHSTMHRSIKKSDSAIPFADDLPLGEFKGSEKNGSTGLRFSSVNNRTSQIDPEEQVDRVTKEHSSSLSASGSFYPHMKTSPSSSPHQNGSAHPDIDINGTELTPTSTLRRSSSKHHSDVAGFTVNPPVSDMNVLNNCVENGSATNTLRARSRHLDPNMNQSSISRSS